MPVSARSSNVQELLSQLRVRLIVTAPEGGSGGGLGLANAAHLGAEVNRLEVDGDAVSLQDARKSLGDLAAEPFLDGKRRAKRRTSRVSLEMPMMCSWAT
jgi:hypothetical protein